METGCDEHIYYFQKLWNNLKESGVSMVFDDYGMGYSDTYRLGNLTPKDIKINRHLTLRALSSS